MTRQKVIDVLRNIRREFMDIMKHDELYFRHTIIMPRYLDETEALGLAIGLLESEHKSGRWKQEFSPAYKGGGYTECSNCEYKFSFGAYFEAESWKYCPECGARMKGDEI